MMARQMLQTVLFMLMISASIQVHANHDEEQMKRGEYIFNMAGCASCHTVENGLPLAGGLKMETKFGVFYTPNISSDKATGIGNWSDEDFIRAMTKGEKPDGQHYYPSFPYTSYAKMTKSDLIDLKIFLDSQPAISQVNKPHALSFPFNIRSLLTLWKFINFDGSAYKENNEKTQQWNRGAYIVQGPGHCVECHTPRNVLGGLDTDELLNGNPEGPEGETVPGLTKESENRISQWSEEDIIFSLQIGMIPDGDFLGGSMGHVIENTTSKLSDTDLKSIAIYLKEFGNK